MKKGLLLVVYAICLIGSLAICGFIDCHYSMEATVDKTTKHGTTYIDITGNIWENGDTNWYHGQKVKLCFYNNGTLEDRTDDIIDKVVIYK